MEKLRVSSIYGEIWGSLSRPPRQICGGGDYTGLLAEIAFGDFRGLAQQSPKLILVQAVPADHGAVEQQDRDIQAVAAEQLGISVNIHHCDGR
jgi:hypothetical protein